MQLSGYSRFEATGEVRSTFNNIPWIQVTGIKEIPRALSKKTIGNMARGFAYKKRGDHLKATLEFAKAYSDKLPVDVQYLIRKEEGRCLFVIGSYSESVDALEDALDILESTDGKKDEETEFLLKEAYAMLDYEELMAEQSEELEDIEWREDESTEEWEELVEEETVEEQE